MNKQIETSRTNTTLWHAEEAGAVAAQLGSSINDGLSAREAEARLARVGPNTLAAGKKTSFWEEFFEELREPLVLMLLATGILYAIWGELGDAIIIFIIILALNTVEVVNEQRSKTAIASLRKLAEPVATVRREGKFQEIPVEQVVPGDLILLQAGRRAPADARLVSVAASGLAVDESTLTGESFPVEKSATPVAPDEPLDRRCNMVYASTLVSRGKGTAIAVATGMDTEIGRIAGMARQVKEPRTPLQNLMEELSKTLVWFALGVSVLVPLAGIFLARQAPRQMLLTGLSLAFATIPEELPIIITMVLSLGAYRLSKKHAIAKNLKSVESLGSVTVIATDKTGTLTENSMEAAWFEPEASRLRLLETGILCNDAILEGTSITGDPVDAALLRAAQKAGLDLKAEQLAHPRLEEFTFDNDRKRMSAVFMRDGRPWAAVKGAPESVLGQCARIMNGEKAEALVDGARKDILERVDRLATDGLRVLAFAERALPDGPRSQELAESDLTLIGLVGLVDPARPEARDAIATCRRAGVRLIMITGDHPLTARAIGRQVGLDSDQEVLTGPDLDRLSDSALVEAVRRVSIFARATPEHKLRIVQALQARGERVAVTGDGVNDAPALAAADIGVAMGDTGTDVAREASDLVLADDNFTTIVAAVEEGRLIYENLKKGVRYYLACKLALVLITLLPALLIAPVPFAPVQIILMELFMDLMAAASFVVEKPEADLLDQKPRNPQAKFMDKSMIRGIVACALGLAAAVTTVYLATWYGTHDLVASQTMAFFSWLVGHVLLAFNMRSERQPLFQIGPASNRIMILWAAAVAVFLIAVSLIPGARPLMKITGLSAGQWGLILVATAAGTFWLEIKKFITYKNGG